jgi:methyltransferase (TIGR00027 family)
MIKMEETEKRIESKISRTAEITCMARAASFHEKNAGYKSNDYIAPKLLPTFFIPIVKIGTLRKLFINRFFPPGMYEYIIARTKFIDSIFQNAVSNEFDQILIFGAGFDSRGIRFADLNKKTRIFELDAPITQEAKINQLKKRGVEINSDIVFISIDFNKESLENKLLESGFNKNQKSLFILEGLTMYLDPEAVDSTFNILNQFAGNGSEVVFDYVYSSVLRGENLYYGESEVLRGVKKENEPWSFGIEKGEINTFLEERNLKLVHNFDSKELEKEFFEDKHGNTTAKVNGTHCIAYARKL